MELSIKKKTSNELLNKLKTYCYSFGIPKIILTNNGTEVKNKEIENFCNVNAIFHQFSPPYDPKVNGAVEALYQQTQKIIFSNFYINHENFDLEEVLLNSINYHNNNTHTSTLKKPIEIRDTTDINVINEVNDNIFNRISKMLKNKKKSFRKRKLYIDL